MQSVTIDPLDAIALAGAAMIGALEEGQPTPDSAELAAALRRDAVALVEGTGLTPGYVIELAKRVAREAGQA